MIDKKQLNDEQISNIAGGSYDLDDPITPTDYYITVLYCEKGNPTATGTVRVLVPVGSQAIDVAKAWCEENYKTYLDWAVSSI